GELILHVAAQVPSHRLQPGEGVDRAPWLDLVSGVGERQQGVLQAHRAGTRVTAIRVDPRIDAGRVRLQVLPRLGGEQIELLLGHPAPTERAYESVGRHLAGAEQLREAPRRDVTAEVHLPEAVLGVHIALGHEQVMCSTGVDLWNPVRVPIDGDRSREPGQRELAGVSREGSPYGP